MGPELLEHCFQGVAKNMGSVTKALEKAVNSMELEKITEVGMLKSKDALKHIKVYFV